MTHTMNHIESQIDTLKQVQQKVVRNESHYVQRNQSENESHNQR